MQSRAHPRTHARTQVLLPYVKDSRQADAFKEKLCQRFEALQEVSVASAADFAAAKGQGGADTAAPADPAAAARGDSSAPGDAGRPSGSERAQHAGAAGDAAENAACVCAGVSGADAGASGPADPGSAATAANAAAACVPMHAPESAPASALHSPAAQVHAGSPLLERMSGGSPAASGGDSFFSACSAGAEATSHRSASASHAGHAQGELRLGLGCTQGCMIGKCQGGMCLALCMQQCGVHVSRWIARA